MPKEKLFTFDFAAERLLQVTKDIRLDGKGKMLGLESAGIRRERRYRPDGTNDRVVQLYSKHKTWCQGNERSYDSFATPVLSGHASSPAKCNLLDPSYTPHVQAVLRPMAHWKYSTWHLHYRYALP